MLRKTGLNGKRLLLPNVPQGMKMNEVKNHMYRLLQIVGISQVKRFRKICSFVTIPSG